MAACFFSSKSFHTVKSRIQLRIPTQAAHARCKHTSELARGRRGDPLFLTTLDPSKLTSQDFMDLSSRQRPGVRSHMGGTDNLVFRSMRFPRDSTGFFYYYVPPPHLPPIMGGVRFRITGSADPSSFDGGSDLLDPTTTMPWQISLLMLTKNKKHQLLRDMVLADGLVPDEVIQRCDMLWRTYPWPRVRPWKIVLYYLEQPFFVRFNAHSLRISSVLKDRFAVSEVRIGMGLFKLPHAKGTGGAIVRFEQSDKRNYLAIRVLKIIEPLGLELDTESGASICQPAEGKLLQRHIPGRLQSRTLLLNTSIRGYGGLEGLLPVPAEQ